MLTKRSHFLLLAVAALAFPAAALAASGDDREEVSAIGDAQAVELAPHSVVRFHDEVEDFTAEKEAERLAAQRRRAREAREEREALEDLPGGVSIETLSAIAACESGGDPTIVSADGSYRGKYQFSVGTWESVGGSGDPAAAPELEQDHRAALLYARSGSSPWPVCG